MNKKNENLLAENGAAASEELPIGKQVKREFKHAAELGETGGSGQSNNEPGDSRFTLPSPLVSKEDAAFANINAGQRGQAFGIDYRDDEPLNTTRKIDERDENRWAMNPASAVDFDASEESK